MTDTPPQEPQETEVETPGGTEVTEGGDGGTQVETPGGTEVTETPAETPAGGEGGGA